MLTLTALINTYAVVLLGNLSSKQLFSSQWTLTMYDGSLITEDENTTISTTFKYMLPENMILSVFILLQNSVILVDYYPDRRKFVTSIFMLIAAFDMIQAFGSVLKAIPAVICLVKTDASVPKWVNMFHFPIAGTSYICCIYFNVVLSAAKTINIRNPFFRVNRRAVNIALLCGGLFWSVAAVVGFVDALYNSAPFTDDNGSCPVQWLKMMEGTSTFITYGFATILSIKVDRHDNPVALRSIVEIAAFMLPCVVVFVCMFVQMYFIKKSLFADRTEGSDEVNHVNVTVFLVSMLFVVCTFLHSPDIAFLLARAAGQGKIFTMISILFFSVSF